MMDDASALIERVRDSAPADNVTAAAVVARPAVSIIVPTRNEAGNVEPLLHRLQAALSEVEGIELTFVDDSDDETPAVLRRLAEQAGDGMAVVVIERTGEDRRGGLAGAVTTGIRQASGEWVVVMDADLQHPPEVVPALLKAATPDVDVVVASRHIPGGDAAGLSGKSRVMASGAATWLARAAFPRRLRHVTDPMTGFFAVRRSALELDLLRPTGFKILLELLVRGEPKRTTEIPFVFADRYSGQTKASFREGMRFVTQLIRLVGSRWSPASGTMQRALAFGAVGISGLVVNTLALWLLADDSKLGLHYLVGAALATQISTGWNFALVDRLVYRNRIQMSLARRATTFFLTNDVLLLLRLPLLALLVSLVGVPYLAANVLTLALAFLSRFSATERLVYPRSTPMSRDHFPYQAPEPAARPSSDGTGHDGHLNGHNGHLNGHNGHLNGHAVIHLEGPATPGPAASSNGHVVPSPGSDVRRRRDPVTVVHDHGSPSPASTRAVATPVRGTGYLAHRYHVGATVTIASEIVLPELEFFRAPWLGKDLDIEIHVGQVGTGGVRRRARLVRFEEPAGLRYEEHMGGIGANFSIDLGERIVVTVGPLLARSPHVLYTNVIEALLRLVFASKGRMLLHSACVEIDGVGVMLSARTDTGKTGTVLRLLRENAGTFLSDDMTVIDADGRAYCYPKPLTISSHTLRAVDPGDLRSREWLALNIKSRVHSKGGRGIGLRLGSMNFPIMTVNSLTQMIVSPPKYRIDRLVPCDVSPSGQVRDLFLIERGPDGLEDVSPSAAVDELVVNTDDAYGFPPFRYMAPELTVGGLPYSVLRTREREVLRSFVSHVRVRRLRSDHFGWADEIPRLIGPVSVVLPHVVPAPRQSARANGAALPT